MNLWFAAIVLFLAQNASFEGRVVRTGTSEPVSNATIELRTADGDGAVPHTVLTSAEGTFVFQTVPPGRYRLSATRAGFVPTEFGQRKPNGPGQPIEVAPSQRLTDIQVAMTPTGTIYGRVYDAAGRSVVKANVQALKASYQNGRRTLTMVKNTVTNDLGEYRIFWLPPGQYYVGAIAANWSVLMTSITLDADASVPANSEMGGRYSTPLPDPLAPTLSAAGITRPTDRYLPIYFPDTSDAQEAEPVEVRPAESLGPVNLQLSPVRTRRVRGVVIDGDTGGPLKTGPGLATSIRSHPSTDGASTIANPTTGAFDAQVVPGSVVLSAIAGPREGRIAIPASDRDIDAVQIVVSSGYDLPGQITIEGGTPGAPDSRLASLRVTLLPQPEEFYIQTPLGSGASSNAGALTLKNVMRGDYRVSVTPILSLDAGQVANIPASLQNTYVKSIRYGNVDVLKEGLHVDGPPRSALQIVIAANAVSLSGVVLNANKEPAVEATVVLTPDWDHRNRSDLYRTATTDASGRFQIDRVVPADYKLFAWEVVASGAWQDSQFMRFYEDRGSPVRVESAETGLMLLVIPSQ